MHNDCQTVTNDSTFPLAFLRLCSDEHKRGKSYPLNNTRSYFRLLKIVQFVILVVYKSCEHELMNIEPRKSFQRGEMFQNEVKTSEGRD